MRIFSTPISNHGVIHTNLPPAQNRMLLDSITAAGVEMPHVVSEMELCMCSWAEILTVWLLVVSCVKALEPRTQSCCPPLNH